LYFRDGIRRIDMVLAFEDDEDEDEEAAAGGNGADYGGHGDGGGGDSDSTSLEQQMVVDTGSSDISLTSVSKVVDGSRSHEDHSNEETHSTNDADLPAMKREARAIFEENLRAAGLEMELEVAADSFDRKTYFLKVF